MQNRVHRNRGKGTRSENNFDKKRRSNRFETLPNSRDRDYTQYHLPNTVFDRLRVPSSLHSSTGDQRKRRESGAELASDKELPVPYEWEMFGNMYHSLILEAEEKKTALIKRELQELEVHYLRNRIYIQMLNQRILEQTSQLSPIKSEEEILRLLDEVMMIQFPEQNRDQTNDDAIEVKAIEGELRILSKYEDGLVNEWEDIKRLRDKDRKSQDQLCDRLINSINGPLKEGLWTDLLVEIENWGDKYSGYQESIRKINSQILQSRADCIQKERSKPSQKQQLIKKQGNCSKEGKKMGHQGIQANDKPQLLGKDSQFLLDSERSKKHYFNQLLKWRNSGEGLEEEFLKLKKNHFAYAKRPPQQLQFIIAAMRALRERFKEIIKTKYRQPMEQEISVLSRDDCIKRLSSLVAENKEVRKTKASIKDYLQQFRPKLKEGKKKWLELKELREIMQKFEPAKVGLHSLVQPKMKTASDSSANLREFIGWLIELILSCTMDQADSSIKDKVQLVNIYRNRPHSQVRKFQQQLDLWIELRTACTQTQEAFRNLASFLQQSNRWEVITTYDNGVAELYERFFKEADRLGSQLRQPSKM